MIVTLIPQLGNSCQQRRYIKSMKHDRRLRQYFLTRFLPYFRRPSMTALAGTVIELPIITYWL
jgi:hypothetical protein